MANIPQYTLDKSLLLQLRDAMQEASLDVQQIGLPETTAEGIEQVWKCCDKSGELFSFVTCEVSDKNVFGLKAGAIYLEIGPPARARARKEVSNTFERFERVLIVLGAQKM